MQETFPLVVMVVVVTMSPFSRKPLLEAVVPSTALFLHENWIRRRAESRRRQTIFPVGVVMFAQVIAVSRRDVSFRAWRLRHYVNGAKTDVFNAVPRNWQLPAMKSVSKPLRESLRNAGTRNLVLRRVHNHRTWSFGMILPVACDIFSSITLR